MDEKRQGLDINICDDSHSLGSGDENVRVDEEDSPYDKKASFKLSGIEGKHKDLGLVLSNQKKDRRMVGKNSYVAICIEDTEKESNNIDRGINKFQLDTI